MLICNKCLANWNFNIFIRKKLEFCSWNHLEVLKIEFCSDKKHEEPYVIYWDLYRSIINFWLFTAAFKTLSRWEREVAALELIILQRKRIKSFASSMGTPMASFWEQTFGPSCGFRGVSVRKFLKLSHLFILIVFKVNSRHFSEAFATDHLKPSIFMLLTKTGVPRREKRKFRCVSHRQNIFWCKNATERSVVAWVFGFQVLMRWLTWAKRKSLKHLLYSALWEEETQNVGGFLDLRNINNFGMDMFLFKRTIKKGIWWYFSEVNEGNQMKRMS